ncbi:GTF3C3 [Symbiodinium natans]|uniref:GTF3C3 protein n=1 Tax=Symbiodinium natans TaxID=878477 RepID=A0A812HMF1_9DINO|nr:GTF3C3 [Symbiodinium natans]
MAVGGQDLEESGLLAQRIHTRRQNRKKKKKKKQRQQTAGKVVLQRARENCQATPEARALLSRGHQQFYCGEFADAIETMRAVIREQPGLADPYHVLHQVYTELGEEKKALHHLILCAYFTKPSSDARPLWQKIGHASVRLALMDQACYAFRRSISPRGARTEDDWRSLWELSKLLFQKGNHDQGIEVLYELYEETEEPQLAVEVAKKLVRRHRWRECLALLESCVQKGREATPPRVDLNVLNILAEVLIEMREFEKCARLLQELLHLVPAQSVQSSGASSSTDVVLHSLDSQVLLKKLHNCPVDIVAMLAVAMCQLPNENIGEDPVYNSALEVVLSHPPESHSDLHLLLVDAMLADEGTTADTVSRRWLRRANVRRWSAEQAHRILSMLEDCTTLEVDLRERQAMCRWRLGQVEEAALQLEALLEDPGERTDAELRNMRVRAAEAWIEIGNPSRADQVLSCLSYEDLQRSNALPPPLSAAERKSLYKELSEIIDRTLSAAADAKDVEHAHKYVGSKEELLQFFAKFRHLVYDCELDFKRLNVRSTSARMEGSRESSAPAALEDKANSRPNAAEEDAIADARSALPAPEPGNSQDSLLLPVHAPKVPDSKATADEVLQGATIHKFKRRHLGIQTIEDMFGFEAYLTLVKHGVVIIRAFARCRKESKSREGTVQAAQAVEVCEMILSNRKLVAQRNPVKRRMMRDLAMLSLSLGFEARLWKVVFKHLRNICDRSGSDHVVALCSRLLFTHADVDGMGPSHSRDREDAAPWKYEKAHNASWGHRNTYAAAFTDVRGWALRKLLRRPRAFGLTLLCAHFCIIASQYPFAVAEYSRAHRLAPFEPLPALCTATAYLSFSMSRAAVCRHDLVLKGLTFLQRYRRLRLRSAGLFPPDESQEEDPSSWGGLPAERQPWEDAVTDDPLERSAIQAEVAYNYGRAFHQLSIANLALEAYEAALEIFDGLSQSECQRTDLVVIRRSAAWNLAYLYKAQGSTEMAADILWRHVVW